MQAKIFAILAAAAVAVAQSTFQINTPTTSIIQVRDSSFPAFSFAVAGAP